MVTVELINAAQEKGKQDMVELLVARFEKRLAGETSTVRREGAETRSFPFKWMFVFWIGQIGAVVMLRLVGALG